LSITSSIDLGKINLAVRQSVACEANAKRPHFGLGLSKTQYRCELPAQQRAQKPQRFGQNCDGVEQR
jgi:hypothetical protein